MVVQRSIGWFCGYIGVLRYGEGIVLQKREQLFFVGMAAQAFKTFIKTLPKAMVVHSSNLFFRIGQLAERYHLPVIKPVKYLFFVNIDKIKDAAQGYIRVKLAAFAVFLPFHARGNVIGDIYSIKVVL